MTAPTLGEVVQAAVASYLAEHEEGSMLTGFIVSVDYLDAEGDRASLHATATDQDTTTTLGILSWYTRHVDAVVDRAIRAELEDG